MKRETRNGHKKAYQMGYKKKKSSVVFLPHEYSRDMKKWKEKTGAQTGKQPGTKWVTNVSHAQGTPLKVPRPTKLKCICGIARYTFFPHFGRHKNRTHMHKDLGETHNFR
ncbi:hypothetical protein POVCU2_0095820 [Plasmodium ovale curtisi]|uniref:Uncharacterized protein n=1 Tax=Plasmodium ovale curtisi TaxID=864141 RepID=A0A1A8WLR3_PLAOA|nr:hypothetical protein POVCU1_024050 [Plasmodium ovale curtisi]SBS95434.1 hypothetical protein POVCU2_0095820 [Plasmodium ovale curtisi]